MLRYWTSSVIWIETKGTDHSRERPNGPGKNITKDNKDDRKGSIRWVLTWRRTKTGYICKPQYILFYKIISFVNQLNPDDLKIALMFEFWSNIFVALANLCVCPGGHIWLCYQFIYCIYLLVQAWFYHQKKILIFFLNFEQW